jgi:histone H3/H4
MVKAAAKSPKSKVAVVKASAAKSSSKSVKSIKASGKAAAAPARASTRKRNAPQTFRPNSDLPHELTKMISDIAAKTSADSDISMSCGSVTALEDALENVLETLLAAAHARAAHLGRDTIEAEDLDAIRKLILKKAEGQ